VSGVSRCVGWALLVLALAYPHVAGRVLAVVGVVGGVVLGHFTLMCLTVAGLLLARVALRIYRRRRALRRLLLTALTVRSRQGGRWAR